MARGFTHTKKRGCRGRIRTSTGQLARKQDQWSTLVGPSAFWRNLGSIFRLSCAPHPRDKRACLPKVSSPHKNVNRESSIVKREAAKALRRKGARRTSCYFLRPPYPHQAEKVERLCVFVASLLYDRRSTSQS